MKVSRAAALKLLKGETLKSLKEPTSQESSVEIFPLEKKKGGYSLKKSQIRSILEIKKFNSQEGEGFFTNLLDKAKKFGNNVIGVIKTHIKPTALKIFQEASNKIRAQKKNGRLLEYGELMPTGIEPNGEIVDYRFLGPDTDLARHGGDKPVNALDALAKEHDFAYERAKKYPPNEQAKLVHEADMKFINDFDAHRSEYEKFPFGKLAKNIILGKYGAEKIVSLIKGTPSTLFSG